MPTPDVTVVRRLRVDVVVEGLVVVVELVVVDVEDFDAAGCRGAFVFCTCVDANAVMPEREVSVSAVASPRRIALLRMRGALFGRAFMSYYNSTPRVGVSEISLRAP